MPRRPQYPTFGSVSSGTMRTEDLLDAFAYECRQWGGRKGKKLAREYDAINEEQVSGEEGSYLLEDMFDLLNEVAPPYGYFAAHEGDGADFGWWLSEGWEDAVRDGEAIKVNDSADVPTGYRGEVFIVNDHGNITFGVQNRQGFRKVWSVV